MEPIDRKMTVLVLGLAAVLFLAFLGSVGIFDPEEGRHVAIPVAMLRTGDFVVPHLQGFPYLEKPPLTYWLTAGSFALLGRNETAARLPVALMGLLGTLTIFWMARTRMGPRVAWIAAALSVLTTQWFVQSRYLTTDMILAGWITVALAAFLVAATAGRRRLYWVFYLAVALATLAKGIIGFLLPGMIVALFVALTGRWRLLREMHLLPGSLLAGATVLPWFFLVQSRLPDFFRYFIFDQHVARYVSETAEHAKPIWFFLPVVALGFFPWTAYLPFVNSGVPAKQTGATVGPAARFRPENVFLWTWFGVIFLFFSVSKGKLMPYVLPAYPPLAILLAQLFARLRGPVSEAAARGVRRGSWIVAGAYLLLAPAAFLAARRMARSDGRITLEDLGFWPWAVIGLLAVAGVGTLLLTVLRRPIASLAFLATIHLLFYGTLLGAARAADPYLGPVSLGRKLAEVVGPQDRVILFELQQPSMEFYLGRPPMLVNWMGEYEYGILIQPNPKLFDPDPAAIRSLVDTEEDVYVIVKNSDRSFPAAFGVPMKVVVANRKRTVYRNHPERP